MSTLLSQVFLYGEIELATASGIHVSKFGQARKKLRQGVDWDLNNLRVAYSANGMQDVLNMVLPAALTAELLQTLTELALLDRPEKTPAAEGSSATEVEGTVTRIGGKGGAFVNPLLLELELPDKQLVRIKVRVTTNFRRGMKCPLRWNEQSNQYELARRLPRFAGRW